MDPRDYVVLQIERTRSQLRAASFVNVGKNALRLGGKTVSAFISGILETPKNPIELIDASLEYEESELPLGASVTVDNAFTTKDGIVFDGCNIRVKTAQGAIVSPNQFEYLKNNSLGSLQIFAEAENYNSSVRSVWRTITRIARVTVNMMVESAFISGFMPRFAIV